MQIKLRLAGDIDSIKAGAEIIAGRLDIAWGEGKTLKVYRNPDKLEIGEKEGEYFISYSQRTEFFRGLAILCDRIRREADCAHNEKMNFETCGVMLDCSRGAVFKKETVCDLLERMSLMGLNMFMLYTEDTYEMKKYPWFGYMRGAYTAEELKEIDAYAALFGIELIPCIQTLGHLATTLRWPYSAKIKDTANELLVGADETYEFIEEMFKVCSQCFSSRRIHIGLDEASGVGLGRYLKQNGYKCTYELMTEHLARVCKIAEKYGFSPMMWSDMFFKLNNVNCDYDPDAIIPDDVSEKLPKNIEMVYWDYCMEERKITDKMLKLHDKLQRPTVFAGGIWTWNRIATGFEKSYITAREQLTACSEHKVNTVFATIWGNGFNPYNIYSTLPAMQIWAELTRYPDADMEHIGKMFNVCTGYDFESWKSLYVDDYSAQEQEGNRHSESFCINTSFQHFYNDILVGLLDKTLSGFDFRPHYEKYLSLIAKADAGDMQPLFEQHRLLYEIDYIKCDLGIRLKKAYIDKDRDALMQIKEQLGELITLYGRYHMLRGDIWHMQCKPFGYEKLDMLLGSVEARVSWAKHRLEQYLDGACKDLPELETERFYYLEIDKPIFEVDSAGSFMSVYS